MPSNGSLTVPRASGKLKLAALVAALLASGVLVAGISIRSHDYHAAQSWTDTRAVPMVSLVDVTPAASQDGLILPGTMAAWNSAKLYARVNGYVKTWDHDIGDRVPAGTVLGSIETPELDQQIDQAHADLASAKADYALAKSTAARWNHLLTSNSVSHQEVDTKNSELAAKAAAVNASAANLGRLQAMKDFGQLRAPFAGIVTDRNLDIGDLVGPGASDHTPLFSVADTHQIRVYVSVPQAYSAQIKDGLIAKLTMPDYPGRVFQAHVVGNAGAINTQTGTFQTQLIADNADGALKPGGYAHVTFEVPGQHGLVSIPSSTLVFRAQGTQVGMLEHGNHVVLRDVTLERDLGGTVEVSQGLQAGDHIIDNPPDSIASGEQVRVNGAASE